MIPELVKVSLEIYHVNLLSEGNQEIRWKEGDVGPVTRQFLTRADDVFDGL
jgi:hypothetical protein